MYSRKNEFPKIFFLHVLVLCRGVLWKKAPRAMRAMRGKILETAPFQPYFGCTESFLKVLSNEYCQATRAMRANRVVTVALQPYFGFHWKMQRKKIWRKKWCQTLSRNNPSKYCKRQEIPTDCFANASFSETVSSEFSFFSAFFILIYGKRTNRQEPGVHKRVILIFKRGLVTRPKYTPYRETGVAITLSCRNVFPAVSQTIAATPPLLSVKMACRHPKTDLTSRKFLKGWYPKGWFWRMYPFTDILFCNFLVFLRFGSSALSPSPKGGDPDQVFSLNWGLLCIEDQLWLGVVTVSRVRRVDNAPRAESSRHDGTICVPSGGTVPREVRPYHPCTLRRYDSATPVPSGGTTVPPLYPQEVQRYHPCTWRWYACEIPVFFILKSHLGRWPLYLVQVQGWYHCTSCRYRGGTVVPHAGTRVVPSYLLEVHYHSAPLNTSVLQFYQKTWGGRQQFNCKFRADAAPNRSSFALPNPRGILLRHAQHMTATQCCQYLLFHEFQWAHSSRPFSLIRYPGRKQKKNYDFR